MQDLVYVVGAVIAKSVTFAMLIKDNNNILVSCNKHNVELALNSYASRFYFYDNHPFIIKKCGHFCTYHYGDCKCCSCAKNNLCKICETR